MKEWINSIFSVIATTTIYLIGGFDSAVITLLFMMVFDYVTGIISAIYNKKLSSKVGFKGILKKVLMLIIVCVATLIDRLVGESGAIRTLVIYYYVANEGISILENLVECNVKFPKKLVEVLDQISKKGDE